MSPMTQNQVFQMSPREHMDAIQDHFREGTLKLECLKIRGIFHRTTSCPKVHLKLHSVRKIPGSPAKITIIKE